MIVSIIGKRPHTAAESTCLPAHAPRQHSHRQTVARLSALAGLQGKMTVFHGSLWYFGIDCSLRPQWSSVSSPLPSCPRYSLRRQHYPSYGTRKIPQSVDFFFLLSLDTIFVHLIKHINLAPQPSLYRCEYLERLASFLGCCPFFRLFRLVWSVQFCCSESKTSQTCGSPLTPAKQLRKEQRVLTGLSWPAEPSERQNFSWHFLRCVNLEPSPVIWSDWICYGKYSSHPTVRWSCEHQTQYLASVSPLVIFPAVQTNRNTQESRLLLYSSCSSRRINPPANQKMHWIWILYIRPPVLKRVATAPLLNSVEDVTAANVTLHDLIYFLLFF